MNRRLFVILMIAALVSLMTGCGFNNSAAKDEGFPDLNSFTATTLDGNGFSEQDLADADLTMINIWSTTCGPCVREMPELAELAQILPDNIKLITFCFDAAANPGSVQEILNDAGFEGVTLVESDGDLESLLQKIQYVPTTVFVDCRGNQIGEAIIGAPNNAVEYYKQAINDALEAMGKDAI